MALVLKDRVKETTTTTGTGTITLAGAVSGFQSFAAVGNANTTYYTIQDTGAGTWEVGIGTYTASGTTLSRTTVLSSSNGGSLVDFGAGSKDVFVTYPSEYSDTAQIGDVQLATTAPTGPGTWLETGKYYSKAAYPELAAAIGSVADMGTPITVPQAQLPQTFATSSGLGTPYITATNGTVTVAVGASAAIRKTTDGSNWVGVPSTTTSSFNEVRYINGNFVAVGTTGGIVSSTDGTTWTARAAATNANITSVTYGNGKYVAVGASGSIQYSTDLVTWTLVTATNTAAINRVIYSNSLFVAVGSSALIYTSTDGVTWTPQTVGSTNFYDVIYANSLFVAVSNGSAIYTSPDAVTWTLRSAGSGSVLFNITYGNSLFVAVGASGTLVTSPDGVTWTNRALTAFAGQSLTCVIWNGSSFYTVTQAGNYATSSDGLTWALNKDDSLSDFYSVAVVNSKTIAFGVNSSVILAGATRAEVLQGGTWAYTVTAQSASNPRTIAYNGSNQYVAVGSNGAFLTSTDGQTWVGRWAGTTLPYDKVQYLNGNYLAMGTSSSTLGLMTSSDGITWTGRTTLGNNLNAAAYGASVYVVVGITGAVYSSPDLTTWTSRSAGGQTFIDVIFANSIFVAVGTGGSCYSSPDGITWTSRSAGSQTVQRIIYANSLFVTVAASGIIYTSPDGITWTSRTSNVSAQLNDVTWNGSLFCAVGATGAITTSSDGLTWTNRTPGDATVTLNSISWNGTRFVVTNTTNGVVWHSTDGITWTRASTVYQGTPLYSGYLGGKFLAIGTGYIQTSTDGLNWTAADPVQYIPTTVSKLYKFGSSYYATTVKGIYQSTDGITFTLGGRSLPSGPVLSIGYSGSVLVAVSSAVSGQPMAIYKSTDGVTWAKSADLGTRTTTSTIAASAVDLVYSNGNFILGTTSTTAQGLGATIYTSTDGVTWTGRLTPALVTPNSSIATDGTTAVFGSSVGTLKSTDGGLSWTIISTVSNSPVIYDNGVWIFSTIQNFTVSPDLSTFYSVGITAAAQVATQYYVSGNYVVGVIANNAVYFNKNASGYTALPLKNNWAIPYAGTQKEIPIRGTTGLLPSTVNQAYAPNPITEIPLYSYDTTTTFWIPPSNAGAGQQAYIYAGA